MERMGAPHHNATTAADAGQAQRRSSLRTWFHTLDGDRRIAAICLLFLVMTPVAWCVASLGLSYAGRATAALPAVLALLVAGIGVAVIATTHRDNTLRRNEAVRAALSGEPPLPTVAEEPDPNVLTLGTTVREPVPMLDVHPALEATAVTAASPGIDGPARESAAARAIAARQALEAEPRSPVSQGVRALWSSVQGQCTDLPITPPTSPETHRRTQGCIDQVCEALRNADPAPTGDHGAHSGPDQQTTLNLLLSFLPSPQQAIPVAGRVSKKCRNSHVDYIFDLSGASLAGLDFHGTAWTVRPHTARIVLTGADLRATHLAYADLRDADLTGTNLRDADLQQANLHRSSLRSACLQNASLDGVALENADLRDADLRHSTLHRANLKHTKAQKASLSHATLTGSNLQCSSLWGTVLQHANLSGTNLRRANLWEASLRYSTLQHAALQHASLHSANLQHADLQHTVLHYADMWSADLRHSILHNASLWQANLTGVQLAHAKLADAALSWTHPHHPDLTLGDLLGTGPWCPQTVCDALAEAKQELCLPDEVVAMIQRAALGTDAAPGYGAIPGGMALTGGPVRTNDMTMVRDEALGRDVPSDEPPPPTTTVSELTAARLDGATALASTFDGAHIVGVDFSRVCWVTPHGGLLDRADWPAYATDR